MSLPKALFILTLAGSCLVLIVWIFLRGWSAQLLPLWAKLIWGLIVAVIFIPRFLPASIRWSESVSLVQVTIGLVVVVLGIKCLILLIREGNTLSSAQRSAAWLGIVPLMIGALMLLFFFWMAGAFNSKK
ncbi:MAG: hypothetical protein HUU01_08935 [Saprospiraceae bacterium]|nr:hypothetical protein [Saprospiraceae bacterium]